MSEWEKDFSAGERQAFMDRKAGRPAMVKAQEAHSPAWWQGYLPRDPSWSLRPIQGRVWWQEREEVEA